MCKPVNNIPPVQSQAIPPLLEKQGPRNSPDPLAWSWSSSTATARGWTGNFPADCVSISKYQCVKWEAYHGSTMTSAALCQSLDSSPVHLPRLGGSPAPEATVCLLSGLLPEPPFPAPLFPWEGCTVGNQTSHEVRPSSEPAKKKINAFPPKQICFFPSPPPVRNLRITVTDLSSHFGVKRDFFHSQKFYIFPQTSEGSSDDHL